MKKFVGGFLLTLCTVFMGATNVLAGPSIDQQFTSGGASVNINANYGRFAQTFKPTYTKLAKVELELANIAGSKTLTVSIRHRTGLNWDEGFVATVSNQTIVNGWNTFDFEDITVGITDNDSYGIYVSCPDDSQWKYSSGPSTYDRGFAIWQSQDKLDWDFNFKTWGYDPVEMVDENTQPDEQASDTNDNSGSIGTAPATSTVSSIGKPTELQATYSDQAVLAWKASSTTDITGYYVFRSEKKGSGYTKIGQTIKDVITYNDKTVVASKTYYYVVRAYKGADQSASSNEASLAIPANAKPSLPQNFEVLLHGTNFIKVQWDKNPEENISNYILTIKQGSETVSTVTVVADVTNYTFKDLTADTEYSIELKAKNSNDLESDTIALTQKTDSDAAVTYDNNFEMTTASWILLVIAIILTAFLIWLESQRRKKAKKAI